MVEDKFDKFITENREQFDDLEPASSLWDNIDKGPAEKKSEKKYLSIIVRVAAVFVIGITIFFSYNQYNNPTIEIAENNNPTEDITNDIASEINELVEAESYYFKLAINKMDEIKKCYKVDPEIEDNIKTDLAELDEMYAELKFDLNENIDKQQIIEAMIQNSRYKLELLEDVLNRVKC